MAGIGEDSRRREGKGGQRNDMIDTRVKENKSAEVRDIMYV